VQKWVPVMQINAKAKEFWRYYYPNQRLQCQRKYAQTNNNGNLLIYQPKHRPVNFAKEELCAAL
jgi:hypothetical protein